ncbi:MAG: NADH-quinone oxidoreductase subunit J family protein [Chthoniobacterales bacterium]
MNSAAFIGIAVLTLSGALAAALLPKLIHAALCLVIAFLGIAAFYFWLGAEFVGLVQVFVYVGAVAVLIVFTILLTPRDSERRHPFQWSGAAVAVALFGSLVWTILRSPTLAVPAPVVASLTVRRIGEVLMTDYVWPLECVGLVLTVALLGALVLVLEEKR